MKRRNLRFFVGGLPVGVSEGSVRGAFDDAGVDVGFVEIVLNASTGVSRGFAFVDFPGAAESVSATAFLTQLREVQLDGRRLTISEIPVLEERLGSLGAMLRAGRGSAREFAALESWDDEGGRNAP